MDEEIERLVIAIRADTRAIDRDLAGTREAIGVQLPQGAERAGRAIERALLGAVRSGTLGLEDLKKVALGVLGEIAAAALHQGIGAILGGGGGEDRGGFSLPDILRGGLPGRATGGPVSPGRAYRVGEHGPETFVPTASGHVVPAGGIGAREVRVAITVHAGAGDAPKALTQSSRQVARAVKAALAGVE